MKIIRDDGQNGGINLGGKANSLLRLSQNNINVPRFFVISNELFEQFLRKNDLSEIVKTGDENTIQASIGGGCSQMSCQVKY